MYRSVINNKSAKTTALCFFETFCISYFCFISQTSPGQYCALSFLIKPYILQPIQIPKADSENIKIKQIRQAKPVIGLKAFIITRRKNIITEMVKPINQANFFCSAPTNSGF